MNLHPSVKLDATNTRQRETAVARIEKMRDTLNTLTHFIEHADAEALRGDLWASKIEDAELELTRALRTATHDGQARMGWRDG